MCVLIHMLLHTCICEGQRLVLGLPLLFSFLSLRFEIVSFSDSEAH